MPGKQPTQHAQARQIDWSSAEFRDGTLTVELAGDAAKGWGRDFSGVLALLEQSNRAWGEIKLRKSTIQVTDVQEASAQALRHFLESVVLQVNSDLGLEDPVSDGGDGRGASDGDAQRAAERETAATFRGFAQPDA